MDSTPHLVTARRVSITNDAVVAVTLSAVAAAHCLHLIVSPAELGSKILTWWNPELVRLAVREEFVGLAPLLWAAANPR